MVSWLCRLEPPREPIDRLIARYRFRQLSRNSRSRCRSSHDTRRRPFDCRCQVAGLTKVSLGQKHTSHFPIDVRFTPESGHELSGLGCPLSAKSGPQCANSSLAGSGCGLCQHREAVTLEYRLHRRRPQKRQILDRSWLGVHGRRHRIDDRMMAISPLRNISGHDVIKLLQLVSLGATT